MANEKNANRREDVHFRILRMLEQNPRVSQREIARTLGVSLGGVNYCLNALVDKGHVMMSYMDLPKRTFRDFKSQSGIYDMGARAMRVLGLERGGKR